MILRLFVYNSDLKNKIGKYDTVEATNIEIRRKGSLERLPF